MTVTSRGGALVPHGSSDFEIGMEFAIGQERGQAILSPSNVARTQAVHAEMVVDASFQSQTHVKTAAENVAWRLPTPVARSAVSIWYICAIGGATRIKPAGFDARNLASSSVLVPDEPAVDRYLGSYPSLAVALPAICAHVRKQLGDAVELSLELYRDPEIDDSFLALYVRQETYDASVMDRIQAAREPLDLASGEGCLLVTTDFRPPRKKHALHLERPR